MAPPRCSTGAPPGGPFRDGQQHDCRVSLLCRPRARGAPSLARVPAGLPGATRPAREPSGGIALADHGGGPARTSTGRSLSRRGCGISSGCRRWPLPTRPWSNTLRASRGVVVIPTKLFTMFSSLDKAIDDVAEGRATIERAMKRIAGSEEWGIRITRKPAAPIRGTAAPARRPTSGAAFLAARKDARDASASLRRRRSRPRMRHSIAWAVMPGTPSGRERRSGARRQSARAGGRVPGDGRLARTIQGRSAHGRRRRARPRGPT